MIIDIDIKIADSDGKLLHRLEKRIDKFDFSNENLNFNLDMGKSFENFLSEYMSYSGRVIRERLIQNLRTSLTDNQFKTKLMNQEAEREVEYRISVGASNVFIGKFPFHDLTPVKIKDDTLNTTEYDNAEEDTDWDITSTMSKAIEKYEANFYQINQENEPFNPVMGLDA